MRNFKIAAAVSALCAAGSAWALPPTATYDISLVVAGASAQRNTFQQEFSAICQASTLNLYQASPTTNQDFRAYSCTLNTTADVPASIRGRNAIVYYRSEGGSVYGVGPLAKNVPVKRLLVNSACSTAVAPAFGNCTVTGYNLATDGVTSGNLTDSIVDLGVSDVEPKRFTGENWPSASALGSEPTAAQISSLTSQTATATVFGIIVHDQLPVSDLSRQDIASIFTGVYGDWGQVADGSNAVDASGPITICRREQGSGTQVGASIYFNAQGCASGLPFVEAPSGPIFGNDVFENGTSTSMNTCVQTHPGSIGIQTYTVAPPTGTKWVTINGKLPSKLDAALGDYDYWFESNFNKDEVIAAKPLPNALADYLITRARNAATIPVNDSVFAINNGGLNAPVIPVNTTRPVGLATRNGDSCQNPQGAL